MSETEIHIGKLKRIECDSQNEFAAGIMQSKLGKNGGEMPSAYETPLEWMLSELYEYYVSTQNGLYEIIEDKQLDLGNDINEYTQNEDGTISFVTMFYNGGASLTEMLEEGLAKLEKK